MGFTFGAGNWLNHSTRDAGFRLRTPAPVKTPRQEALQGVFSIEVDLKYLVIWASAT